MSEPRARWRVCRAGLINVFEYGEQVFEFGGGRLLLRGPNGSGKSKALELLFPFLFEGDMAAAKLDPFGKRARKMKWNLLMDGKHVRRTGYAWLELRERVLQCRLGRGELAVALVVVGLRRLDRGCRFAQRVTPLAQLGAGRRSCRPTSTRSA